MQSFKRPEKQNLLRFYYLNYIDAGWTEVDRYSFANFIFMIVVCVDSSL